MHDSLKDFGDNRWHTYKSLIFRICRVIFFKRLQSSLPISAYLEIHIYLAYYHVLFLMFLTRYFSGIQKLR